MRHKFPEIRFHATPETRYKNEPKIVAPYFFLTSRHGGKDSTFRQRENKEKAPSSFNIRAWRFFLLYSSWLSAASNRSVSPAEAIGDAGFCP